MIVIINVLIIIFSVSYIIGHSGILFDLSKWVYERTHNEKWNYQMIGKPFGCTTCMSFWLTLIYVLISGIGIISSLGIACVASIGSVLIGKVIGVVVRLINKIE
jgi:hypothetical protein